MITYNHEDYISQAIEGVLMQKTNFLIELIIGEDCSTDKTREICIKYQQQYSDIIKLQLPETNKGMMRNFIENMQAAQGKYIAICEGDDYWIDPLKLQKQVDFLEANKEFGLCFTDVNALCQDTKIIEESVLKNSLTDTAISFENHLINKRYLAPCTWVFRSEMLNFFIQTEKPYLDGTFAMLLDVLKHGKIYFLRDATAVYRISAGTASRPNSDAAKYRYLKGIFEIQQEYIVKYDVDKKLADCIYADSYLKLLKYAIAQKDTEFIEEAEFFFGTVQSFTHLYTKEIELEKIRASKAYRLGKFLLKPYAWLRKRK